MMYFVAMAAAMQSHKMPRSAELTSSLLAGGCGQQHVTGALFFREWIDKVAGQLQTTHG